MTDVLDEVLAAFTSGNHHGVVVDSPPGAGKSTLVVNVTRAMVSTGHLPLMIVAQTNEQVDDLIVKIAKVLPAGLTIGRLSAQGYPRPHRVASLTNVTIGSKVDDLGGALIVIGTAAKWATLTEGTWDWAIVDEAYQMRSDMLLRIANRFKRALFVGDPGQLDPFSVVESERWIGLSWDPMQSAVAVMLRHNPHLPVYKLPKSWRLPATAAPVVSAAFYPLTGFEAGSTREQRRLTFARPEPHAGPVDAALDMAAETGWALYELPARYTLRTDAEAAKACAELAERVLGRQGLAYSSDGPDGTTEVPARVAIGAAHRDQVAAIQSFLSEDAREKITVDTANRLQGREYDVTVVLHPLSGRRDATAFHLESGRLCVLTSRHRQACIVVARAGIPELLDAHPSTEPVHLNVPLKFPDGWEANQAVMAHLHRHRVALP